MRGFTNCSEPVSFGAMNEFAAAFRHIGVKDSALWVCYAMAENAFAVTASGGLSETPRMISADRQKYAQGIIIPTAEDSGIGLVSCGVPIEGCEIRVVDDQRQQLPDAQIGEISLRSTFMLTGYVRSPELTREAIDDSKWYYTGDLGFLIEGRLYVTGRKKDLLIVGGRNFYPQDIEGIVGSCEGTIPGRTVAIGTEDLELGTQKVVILAESHLSDEMAKSKLATTIRQQVFDGLDCPIAEVHIVPHMWLLKTSSGKIARQPNLEKYRAEHAVLAPRKITEAAPAPIERAGLAETAMWSMALALSIYLYTLFFLLGDSKSWNIYARF
jgi:acyl-CoA synthetase (AMP-forming)/AMP-acid ligase II